MTNTENTTIDTNDNAVIPTIEKSFYDHSYWQSGQGARLWEQRKMLAFIMEISNEDTPFPFFTALPTSDFDDTPVGYIASWNDGGDDSLTLEFENGQFCVFNLRFINGIKEGKLESDMAFWYNFGDPDLTKEDNNDWSEFRDAVNAAKNWLEVNREMLKAQEKEGHLERLFNIKS